MKLRRGRSGNAHNRSSDAHGTGGDDVGDAERDAHRHDAGSRCLSPDTEARVRHVFQHQCWLCSQESHGGVTHVFPSADEDIFREHRANGIITAPSINSVENLLFLCPNCRDAFGRNSPAWVMLPTGMSEMIAEEESFQARRQREHDAGRPYARLASSSQFRAYQRFVVRRSFFKWNIGAFSEMPIKDWKGDPACAILRSAGFLTIAHHNPLLQAVTPQYLLLLELYQRPIPPVAEKMDNTNQRGSGDAPAQPSMKTRPPRRTGYPNDRVNPLKWRPTRRKWNYKISPGFRHGPTSEHNAAERNAPIKKEPGGAHGD
ncbi:MAG: hypothetical protein M1840_005193 [Geoglossum simile]|nr:MAG: hypothetical protein M1840_005193 [Geoglossum simile]